MVRAVILWSGPWYCGWDRDIMVRAVVLWFGP